MTLVPVDTTSAIAVSDYLTRARDWLSTAVEMTGPEQIAAAKAEIATAAEATKQLGLSKEIQLDAQEMVRRAEYALGKAIRKGQAEGTIATRGRNLRNSPEVDHPDFDAPRPVTDFATRGELYGNRRTDGVLGIVDDSDDSAFDAAIDEAKAEGNLSRANVARKARERSGPTPAPAGTNERNHQEAELVNAFSAIVRRSLTPKNVSTLSPKAKGRILAILENAILILKGDTQ